MRRGVRCSWRLIASTLRHPVVRFVRATLVLAVALVWASESAAQRPDLPVERHRFANGLRVVLAPDPTLDDITVLVRYGVGSGDDPAGMEGLAHLVEHLQFAGSRHVAAGEHARLLEVAGAGGFAGETLPDATTYAETVPAGALALALWLESDRMAFPADNATEATVAHERTILAHEYASRAVDSQFGLAKELLLDEVYPAWHPYHRPSPWAGVAPEIRLRDIRAFLRTWYMPANAAVILVGPFEKDVALALVAKYFESLPSSTPPARPPLGSWSIGDLVLQVRSRIEHRDVMTAWKTPAFRDPDDRALDVGAALLAGSNGFLVRDLVDRGLATAVGASEASARLGSAFGVEVHPADQADLATVEDAIERAVAWLAAGADPASIVRAREALAARTLLRLETSYGRARCLGDTLDTDDPWELDVYEHVDAAALSAATRRWLLPQGRATLLLSPFPARARRPAWGPAWGGGDQLAPELRIEIEKREKRAQ